MRFRHFSGLWGVIAIAVFSLPGAGLIVVTYLGMIDAGSGESFALFGLGAVMIAAGAAAALWRVEVVIEGGPRTVTEKRWLVGFTRSETYAFDTIERVEIRRRPMRVVDRFEVRLDVSDGSIFLEELSDQSRAHELADQVADLTGLKVVLVDEPAAAE